MGPLGILGGGQLGRMTLMAASALGIDMVIGERFADSERYERLQFEELQANPPAMLERLARFCDLKPSTGQLATAAASIRPLHTRPLSA